MFLELITLLVILTVLGIKWLTTTHKAALRRRLVEAEVLRTKNEQRYKLFQKERQAAEAEEKGVRKDLELLTGHLNEQQELLSEQEARNRELQEQIGDE